MAEPAFEAWLWHAARFSPWEKARMRADLQSLSGRIRRVAPHLAYAPEGGTKAPPPNSGPRGYVKAKDHFYVVHPIAKPRLHAGAPLCFAAALIAEPITSPYGSN